MREAQESQDPPSVKFSEIGQEAVEGYAQGIDENASAVTDAVSTLVAEALSTAKTETEEANFASIGEQITAGIAKGIEDGKSGVVNALVAVLQAAQAEGESKMEINSPSKLMKRVLGAPIAEGIAVGIEDNIDMATGAMEKLTNETVEAGFINMRGSHLNDIESVYGAGAGLTKDDLNQAIARVLRFKNNEQINLQLKMDGTMSQFARALRPHLESENNRVGTSLVLQEA